MGRLHEEGSVKANALIAEGSSISQEATEHALA
jgi:hypothetical protein